MCDLIISVGLSLWKKYHTQTQNGGLGFVKAHKDIYNTGIHQWRRAFDKIVNKGKLSERSARRYFQQLIDAIAYCHGNGVYHRYLKARTEKDWKLKVSDFGLSALPQESVELLYTTCGTPNYIAPETIAFTPTAKSSYYMLNSSATPAMMYLSMPKNFKLKDGSQIRDDLTWGSLGRRVFDIYLQVLEFRARRTAECIVVLRIRESPEP
ncbi:CBL-interacting serine/threonine-protein kinase 24-like protein [Tanacetum coccineum]